MEEHLFLMNKGSVYTTFTFPVYAFHAYDTFGPDLPNVLAEAGVVDLPNGQGKSPQLK